MHPFMFERYIFNLYCKSKVPPDMLTLAVLRRRIFSKNQADSEKLLQVLATLEEKVNWAHYISLQWKSSHISNSSLLDPSGHRWYYNTNKKIFELVMTKLLPKSILHLTVCNSKTKCVTNRCKCQRDGLNCSKMFGCEHWKNDDKDEEIFLDCRSGDDRDDF